MKQFFNRSLRVLLVTNGLILFAGGMLGPITAIFVEKVGGDIFDAGIAGAIFAFAAGITSLISGRVIDALKQSKLVLVFGYLIMSGGFLFYAWVDSVSTLFIAQVIIGLGEALYSPAFDEIYTKHLDKGKAGREWGAWESMNYFTFAIAAGLGGWIASQFGFTPIFIIMSTLALVSAIYLYLVPKRIL